MLSLIDAATAAAAEAKKWCCIIIIDSDGFVSFTINKLLKRIANFFLFLLWIRYEEGRESKKCWKTFVYQVLSECLLLVVEKKKQKR